MTKKNKAVVVVIAATITVIGWSIFARAFGIPLWNQVGVSSFVGGIAGYVVMRNKIKGFTLVEALVVIAIIGILAGITVLSRAREEAKRKANPNPTPVMPSRPEAEKSPVFPSGQEVITVYSVNLEDFLSKNKKRIISVCPVWKEGDGGGRVVVPSHYLIVLE